MQLSFSFSKYSFACLPINPLTPVITIFFIFILRHKAIFHYTKIFSNAFAYSPASRYMFAIPAIISPAK